MRSHSGHSEKTQNESVVQSTVRVQKKKKDVAKIQGPVMFKQAVEGRSQVLGAILDISVIFVVIAISISNSVAGDHWTLKFL